MKKTLEFLRKYIKRSYGSKCKEFNISCSVCQQYLALEIISYNLELEEVWQINPSRGKKRKKRNNWQI